MERSCKDDDLMMTSRRRSFGHRRRSRRRRRPNAAFQPISESAEEGPPPFVEPAAAAAAAAAPATAAPAAPGTPATAAAPAAAPAPAAPAAPAATAAAVAGRAADAALSAYKHRGWYAKVSFSSSLPAASSRTSVPGGARSFVEDAAAPNGVRYLGRAPRSCYAIRFPYRFDRLQISHADSTISNDSLIDARPSKRSRPAATWRSIELIKRNEIDPRNEDIESWMDP